jgi:hypothetical protein
MEQQKTEAPPDMYSGDASVSTDEFVLGYATSFTNAGPHSTSRYESDFLTFPSR